MRILIISFVWIFTVLGCEEDTFQRPLTDDIWKLEMILSEINGAISINNPDKYLIEFNEDGRVSGLADCNTCFGEYYTKGDSISIAMGCTKMGCGQGSFGGPYLVALSMTSTYEISGNILILTNDDGILILH